MKRFGALPWMALGVVLLLLPAIAEAAGGGKLENVVIVSDTRDLKGLLAWWGDLYNHSHVYFTVLTVILIPTIGVLFGMVADLLMHTIGIDLKTRKAGGH